MDNTWAFVLLLGFLNHANSQVVLQIVTVEHAPYVMSSRDGDGFEGFIPDVLDELASMVGFDYNMSEVADKRFGRFDAATSKWDGMMGQVVDKKADIAVPITVTSKRSEYVDFTYPLQSADTAIVLQRPQVRYPSLQDSLIKLLIPMEFPVWLMTVLAFLVTSTVLYIISHTNPYEWRRMAKDKEATVREAESFTCLNTFWFIISTLAWQGYVRAPRSMGGRITVTAWWFFVLIFILSYTASLTNYLRVGPLPQEAEGYSKIQSFKDLAENEAVNVAMISGGSTEHGFQASPIPEDNMIYRKAMEFKRTRGLNITSYDEGIMHIRQRQFLDLAFIMESPSAKYKVMRQPCDLYMVSDNRMSRYLALALSKSSPMLGELNKAILTMYEDGRMRSIEHRWFEGMRECESAVLDRKETETYKVPPFHQLDLGTFSGALLILLCGLVLGGLTTAIEFCIYKWAEMHPDEEEPIDNKVDQNDVSTSENLLSPDAKRGGATQV